MSRLGLNPGGNGVTTVELGKSKRHPSNQGLNIRQFPNPGGLVLALGDDEAAKPILPQRMDQSVNHSARQYVVGAVHTNTIEGFWSIFKRGIVGSFHKVSAKYMPLYVAEFQFRYNNRFNDDIFGAAIENA